jgi:ATP-dependent Lon protease
MHGKGKVTITGRLGDVMKESALAAISWIRTNAAQLGIDPKIFQESDFHIHVPAGAIPKDGPSAGVTITASLVSLLSGLPAPADLALTGEITLRGKVLPVGGIKEKVIAAKSSGITRVILPEKNEKDLEDVAEVVKNALTFHFVGEIEQVLDLAFGPALRQKVEARRQAEREEAEREPVPAGVSRDNITVEGDPAETESPTLEMRPAE